MREPTRSAAGEDLMKSRLHWPRLHQSFPVVLTMSSESLASSLVPLTAVCFREKCPQNPPVQALHTSLQQGPRQRDGSPCHPFNAWNCRCADRHAPGLSWHAPKGSVAALRWVAPRALTHQMVLAGCGWRPGRGWVPPETTGSSGVNAGSHSIRSTGAQQKAPTRGAAPRSAGRARPLGLRRVGFTGYRACCAARCWRCR